MKTLCFASFSEAVEELFASSLALWVAWNLLISNIVLVHRFS
jgi:hypothetical protein